MPHQLIKLGTGAPVDEEDGPASEQGAWLQVGHVCEGHVPRVLAPGQCRVELTCVLDQGEASAGDTAEACGGRLLFLFLGKTEKAAVRQRGTGAVRVVQYIKLAQCCRTGAVRYEFGKTI